MGAPATYGPPQSVALASLSAECVPTCRTMNMAGVNGVYGDGLRLWRSSTGSACVPTVYLELKRFDFYT